MSKHDFTTEEYACRRSRVRAAIAEAGLDWLLVFHPVSIHWLTGSEAKSYQEFQCLLISASAGPVVVLTRQSDCNEFSDDALVDELRGWGGAEPEDPIECFERLAGSLGLRHSRVGMEVPAYYLHPYHYLAIRRVLGEALVAEPSNLVHDLKLVKSQREIAYIRAAAGIADGAMSVFSCELSAGRSELSLAGRVYEALMAAGSGFPASPLNLVSGERSSFSHGAPTERRLRPGDFGSIEYGAAYRRYTATIGRQFSIGAPTPRMLEIHAVVREACDVCIANIRDGVPAVVPHQAASRIIAQAGLAHGRIHTTGYGLAPGFPPTWGEPLHMFGDSSYVLRAGMVVTVEPPVFLGDEQLGARIIDNVLVGEDGAELLSQFSRDLIVLA